eukprot:m.32916 g.32916  ORF g.32916 m.32916 type:complete len:257 (+) comp5589_c0_seq1:1830-2600(+)
MASRRPSRWSLHSVSLSTALSSTCDWMISQARSTTSCRCAFCWLVAAWGPSLKPSLDSEEGRLTWSATDSPNNSRSCEQPFISVTSALLYYNWYPSSVFVGDTFCYFAGMLFAVCGILAHFSKTVLLFLIPQIINFVLSLPQLFRIVPCPRHRLPKFNADTRQLNMSYATVPKAELGGLGLLVLKVYKLFRLSHVEESATEFRYSNMTILNLLLFWLGPTPEDRLVVRFLVLQTVTCVFAFYLRYGFAAVLYDIVQ